jgi:hypothetical protein
MLLVFIFYCFYIWTQKSIQEATAMNQSNCITNKAFAVMGGKYNSDFYLKNLCHTALHCLIIVTI